VDHVHALVLRERANHTTAVYWGMHCSLGTSRTLIICCGARCDCSMEFNLLR